MKSIGGIGLLIAIFIASIGGIVLSARGTFGSREKLIRLSSRIGTKNLTVARAACIVGLLVCTLFCLGCIGITVAGIVYETTGKPMVEWFK